MASKIDLPNKNTGVILEAPRERDWRLGGVTGAENKVIVEDGDWTKYLPAFETQNKHGFDTMGCVSFSLCNVLETYAKATGLGNFNFSDRALACASKTTKQGNSFWSVWMTARKYGLVSEESWPWSTDVDSWEEYYKPIPKEIEDEAIKFADRYNISLEWVNTDTESLDEAIRYSPLWVCNKYHAFTLSKSTSVGYETLDQYPFSDGLGRGFWPKTNKLEAAAVITLTEKTIMPEETSHISLMEEALVFEAEGAGRFGLHVRGKIYIDSLDKLLAQWIMRNSKEGKFINGNTVNLTTSDFNSFPHFTLKNERLDN